MSRFAFDHLHLRTRAPEELAAWFITYFEGVQKAVVDAKGKQRIILDVAGHDLFIEEVAEGTAAAPPAPYRGLEHLALQVKDLHGIVAELKAKGANVVMGPASPRPGVLMCFIEGPEGVQVELLQRS